MIGLNRVWPSIPRAESPTPLPLGQPASRKVNLWCLKQSLDHGFWPALLSPQMGPWKSVGFEAKTLLDWITSQDWKLCSLACLSGRGKRSLARPHNILVKTLVGRQREGQFCCCILIGRGRLLKLYWYIIEHDILNVARLCRLCCLNKEKCKWFNFWTHSWVGGRFRFPSETRDNQLLSRIVS